MIRSTVSRVALAMGRLAHDRPNRVSLILVLGHDGIPNLWPLGLMMFLLLAILCLLAPYAERWLGKKAFA
jgi:hypothetical protein